MTVSELPIPPAAKVAEQIGQATAVEQARAIAEVQAAVIVAQQCPRDMGRAEADMKDACGRLTLANRAFYSVPQRGNGPSVHLARELARIWGNVDYGVRELRRDDEAGESEIQAFAWDQQTNVRSTRSFIVPHARMKTINGVQTRQKLIDLGDIYLSNQNIGARAVRECIFSMLPSWFTEAAQEICRNTLVNGEGVPLKDRIANMVSKFGELGVMVPQIEAKIGRKRSAWTPQDAADLAISYTSITRDGLMIEDEFPTAPVTSDEVAAKPGVPMITAPQLQKLNIGLQEKGYADRDEKLKFLTFRLGRSITSSKDLTKDEATALIDLFESGADVTEPPPDGAA